VEAQEDCALSARVRELPDAVEHHADDLLPDGVVATHIVVRRGILPVDNMLRMEQLAVGPNAHFIDTLGSRFTNKVPVSEKKMFEASLQTPIILSGGISLSDVMPCSGQYSSQQPFPV
jgi:hypothetical protein